MATVSDDSDVDDIPEVEYSINIQPYMYEPETDSCDKDVQDSSGSDNDDDLEYRRPGVEEAQLLVNANWYLCNKCVPLSNQEENICCKSQSILEEKIEESSSTCITNHERFNANCLNIHVLETSFYEYVQENGRLRENEHIHTLYRHIEYRRFIRWMWKILGKGNRKILPSCVVNTIRKTIPSETFKYPRRWLTSSEHITTLLEMFVNTCVQ